MRKSGRGNSVERPTFARAASLPGMLSWRLMSMLGGGSPGLLPQRLWWQLTAPCDLFQPTWATKLCSWHLPLCRPGKATGELTILLWKTNVWISTSIADAACYEQPGNAWPDTWRELETPLLREFSRAPLPFEFFTFLSI